MAEGRGETSKSSESGSGFDIASLFYSIGTPTRLGEYQIQPTYWFKKDDSPVA
jgi:hypothetical protein